jgi:hypothetical protein
MDTKNKKSDTEGGRWYSEALCAIAGTNLATVYCAEESVDGSDGTDGIVSVEVGKLTNHNV